MRNLHTTLPAWLFALSLFASDHLHAQQRPIGSFRIQDFKNASVDRIGNLIIQLSDYELQSFDQNGKSNGHYKSNKVISQLDAWNGIRIALFHKADQSITWLNESLEVLDTTLFDPAFVIEPSKICIMPDFSVLVIDAATASLKHIDVRRNILKSEIAMPVTDTILDMKEYQGFTFLKSPDHLYAVNRMGKLIKTLNLPEASSFYFLGEELYYQKGTEVVFFDLLEGTQRSEKVSAARVLYTQDRLFHIQKTEVVIFEKDGQ